MKKIFLHLIISVVMCFNIYATDFGTKEEAENMLERAVNILKLDKSLALELFAEGEGGFIYKDLTNALNLRQEASFNNILIIYGCCFAAALPIRVLQIFCTYKLGIIWRDWLTKKLVLKNRRT